MKLYKPFLAALAASLLFLLYYHDRGTRQERQQREVQQARLIPFDFPETEYIHLRNESGEFEMEKRKNGEWWLTKPKELRADEDQIRTLIDNLHASKKTGEFRATDLKEYALESPAYSVTVRGEADGKSVQRTLLIGNETPQMGRVYARVDGDDQLFTAGDWIRNQMVLELSDLRDKQLLRFQPDAVNTFAVRTQGESFTLERSNGFWWLKEADQPARSQFIEQTLSLLSTAKAISIADNITSSTSELGLTEPILRFTIAAGGETSELRIGNRVAGKEQFYAQSSLHSSIALVRAGLITPMLIPRAEWGTRQFIWIPLEKYSEIHTESGSTQMTILRGEDGAWYFEDYPDLPIHETKLKLAMDAWSNVTAQVFVASNKTPEEEAKDFGIRPETYSVRVTSSAGEEQGFKLGRVDTNDQKAYVKRLQDNTIWKVDVQLLAFTKAFRSDLQDKRIQHGFAPQVATIEYMDFKDTVRYVLEKRNDVWRLRIPGEISAIIGATEVADIVHAVEEMEWDSFTAATGELKPKVRLEFKDSAGESLYWFEELASTADSVTLRTPQGVFEVPRNNYVDVVSKWVRMLNSRKLEANASSQKPDA